MAPITAIGEFWSHSNYVSVNRRCLSRLMPQSAWPRGRPRHGVARHCLRWTGLQIFTPPLLPARCTPEKRLGLLAQQTNPSQRLCIDHWIDVGSHKGKVWVQSLTSIDSALHRSTYRTGTQAGAISNMLTWSRWTLLTLSTCTTRGHPEISLRSCQAIGLHPSQIDEMPGIWESHLMSSAILIRCIILVCWWWNVYTKYIFLQNRPVPFHRVCPYHFTKYLRLDNF